MLKRILVGFLLLFLLAPSGTEASFIDGLGIGARGMALGSAYTAIANDVSAVYYNPAGLANMKEHSILLGFVYADPTLKTSSPTDPFFDAEEVVNYKLHSPVIGIAFNNDKLFKGHSPVSTKFGFILAFPENFKSNYRAWDPEPSTPHWIRAGDYWDRVHVNIAMSLASDKLPWISLGIGFRYIVSGKAYLLPKNNTPGLDLRAEISGIPNLTAEGGGNINEEVDSEAAISAGIMLNPLENLHIGYSFRESLSLIISPMLAAAEASVLLNGQNLLTLPLGLTSTFEAYYLPQEHNVGIAYLFFDKALLSVDLSMFKWSQYKSISRGSPDKKWKDTYIPRVGIEYCLFESLSLRMGYFFEPSPIPEQTNRSNYLDNDRHCISAGAGYKVQDPFRLFVQPINIDFVFQYMYLPTRTTVKQPGFYVDDITAGYETEGDILTFSGNITVNF